jgi:hypothetical protein
VVLQGKELSRLRKNIFSHDNSDEGGVFLRINSSIVMLVLLAGLFLFFLEARPEGPFNAAGSSTDLLADDAASPRTTMTAIVERGNSGKPFRLVVKGEVVEERAYLCISLYRKGFNRDLWWSEGIHEATTLKKGAFERSVLLADYEGGAWEASLYEKVVQKSECSYKDGCWFCRMWGYHLADPVIYLTDYVK